MTPLIGPPGVQIAAPVPERSARTAEAAPAPPAVAPPNPALRFEPVLGLVVFEMRDRGGEVVRSVPTERELRDYRAAALRGETPPAQIMRPPGGMPSSASPFAAEGAGAPKGDSPSTGTPAPPASLPRLIR